MNIENLNNLSMNRHNTVVGGACEPDPDEKNNVQKEPPNL